MAATLINIEEPFHSKSSIVNDFAYRNNVAQAHIYIRLGFLRKVYGIVSVQLLLTTLVAATVKFTPVIRMYVCQNSWMVILALILSLVLIIALHIKRRETPTNFFLLAAFTVVQAYAVAVTITFFDDLVVLQAFLLTAAVTTGLTLYTFQTKRDLSKWGGALFAGLCILMMGGLVQVFVGGNNNLEILLSAGGALLFSMFILYDTHMIMERISAEEYIVAAIELYLDIINLFLELLRLLEALRRN